MFKCDVCKAAAPTEMADTGDDAIEATEHDPHETSDDDVLESLQTIAKAPVYYAKMLNELSAAAARQERERET